MNKCLTCGSVDGVQQFAVTIDGVPLNFAPYLCRDHGERFIFRTGVIMASLNEQLDLAVGPNAFNWAKQLARRLPPSEK